MKQIGAHRNIVDIDVLDTDNLLDPDDMTYGEIDLFHLMGQLTDDGHDDIVDSFRKQVLEFYQVAVVELKQLSFDDPILDSLGALKPVRQGAKCCKMITILTDSFPRRVLDEQERGTLYEELRRCELWDHPAHIEAAFEHGSDSGIRISIL